MTKETTKFSSFWGDMTVGEGSIIPAAKPDKKKDPVVEPDAPAPKTDHEGDDITDPPEGDPPADPESDPPEPGDPPADPKDPEEPEEPEYEYTEDDVSKAYGMLEEEGILVLDEEDEFESNSKGLADAVGATVRNLLKKEIESIPPVVQEFYSHVQEGGDISSFKPAEKRVGWSELNMEEAGNKDIALKAFYMGQGMTDQEAIDEIADIAEDKKDRKAEIAISTLKKRDESILKAKERADKKIIDDAATDAKEDTDKLRSYIDDTEELAGFPLDTKVRKQAFKDYLFKVKPRSGKTQMQENMSNKDRRMQIAMLDFVNYTKADMKKEVSTELTKKRKKKLSRYTDKGVANKQTAKSIAAKIDATKGVKKFPTIFGPSTIEVED